MSDFWVSCGHHLVDKDEAGGLHLTDSYLAAYYARPELMPPPEACPVERGLHASLLAAPRRKVAPAEPAAIADADARENWRLILAFRDHLLAHRTLQAAYLALARNGTAGTPPMLVDQLTHLVARAAYDGETDAFVLRSAEMFFRAQKLTLHEGRLLLADAEAIAGHEAHRAHSPLMSMLGGPAVTSLDVLTAENAASYAGRSDAFDMVLDFRPSGEGRAGLARAVEAWIEHLLALEVTVTPLPELRGEPLAWYVGLDQEGSRLGDALWRGEPIEETARPVALFRLEIRDQARAKPGFAGDPVLLILGRGEGDIVRLKPQNLLAGLPLAETVPA